MSLHKKSLGTWLPSPQRWLMFALGAGFTLLGGSSSADAKPCATAAKGMVCIQGGTIQRSNRGTTKGKRFQATVKTFYIDQHEVTHRDFARCVRAGGCYYPYKHIAKSRFSKPSQPVTTVNWHEAERYCRWAGKRLPTEAEWEHAARSSQDHTYAWGNARPSCKKAHFSGCAPRRPKGARQGSPAANGLYHMSGNVAEWVADWFTPCIEGCKKACGAACQGQQPKGVCGGNISCKAAYQRVIKGGSWAHSRRKLSIAWRAGQVPHARGPAVGFRCASSVAKPRPPKGYKHMQKRATLPYPKGPLPAAQARIMDATPQDDLKNKKLCPKGGRSYSHCRDPYHYILSNEKRQFLWRPFLQNLGGAHIGIGADQNYNFIVWSRSKVAWLMDYDHVIVWIHQLHRAFILKSPTAQDYLEYWKPKHAAKSIRLLRKMYKKDRYLKMILRAYRRYRAKVYASYRRDMRFLKKNPKSKKLKHYWLFHAKNYKYMYLMYKYNRIHLMPGDLLKHNSLQGAAKAARKMGYVVRTCYLSNAEEVWLFPKTYRKYFTYMNFDKLSVIIRTASLRQWRTKKYGWFHYNLQGALHYQKMINARAPRKGKEQHLGFRYSGAKWLLEYYRHRSPIREDLTLIHMPRTH